MSQGKQIIYTVDVFEKGLAFGKHLLPENEDPRHVCSLGIHNGADMSRLQSRFIMGQKNPLIELEQHMMKLSDRGILRRSSIYLGVHSDPFYPFEGKFEKSMQFLELFKKYQPGLLHIQTRSPLIVIAMPIFAKLGGRCCVTLGLETNSEEMAERYTPNLPRVSERLKTIRALQRFGVEVNIQVNPVLPYGDWAGDAHGFAQTLIEHGNSIYLRPLTDGQKMTERRQRKTLLAQKLVEDRRFHWLRPDAAEPLYRSIETLSPEKLMVPKRKLLEAQQLEMFAA